MKSNTIDAYFKRNISQPLTSNDVSSSEPPSKLPRTELRQEVDLNSLIRDPGLRPQISEYPVDKRDEIRRAYIKAGPYQHILSDYPLSGSEKHPRHFQASWFTLFPSWLEYSPSKDAAFCLPCFLFNKLPTGRPGSSTFTIEGFRNWKKVNSGENCAFLSHVGRDSSSLHRSAEQDCKILMKQSQHIDKIIEKQKPEQIMKNRLRLKVSVDTVRWLTFQACAFRGHDESSNSLNRGNFIEMIKFLSSYNKEIDEVVLKNAPGNAKYTSPMIQKEILHVIASKVRKAIREEIGGAKFCIIVDEARDESKREQMAIILRFVDKEGFVRERFFDIVHVSDTSSLTLKKEISAVLSRNNLNIQDIRGQGYDGASNMRGEWNGLQALFLNDCSYAYYVHCFAHRLQLTLVAACKEVKNVYQFFSKLTSVINIVGASCKRHDELQVAHANHIAQLLDIDELESGRGLNQIGTLQRAGDTRWGSYFNSVSSLINMFGATCSVLKTVIEDGSTYAQRGDADAAYDAISSFEFIFILHLMQEILGTTNNLCQLLQNKSLDILNAMDLVSTTKLLIQKLREDGWDKLLEKVISFCNQHNIDVPNMNDRYTAGRGRFRYQQQTHITMEHHYRFDIFVAVIDSQLQELNNRFNEHSMELLVLSSSLDPKNNYKSFNVDTICNLVKKFYPQDFTEQEKIHLRYQLQQYEYDVIQHSELRSMATISELCQGLVKTGKSTIYPLIDRLIRLVLTLPVSTATTERAFSAMKLMKTRLRNKMEDEFLGDNLIVYIEKEIAENFSSDSIIDDFYSMKERRAQLQ